MARTIAEIQQEIIDQKEKIFILEGLTNTSKSSIWKLWTFITASAIWTHEQIVERNSLISRPHTLSWYREQALNFIYGRGLVWKDGFYKFDIEGLSETEIENKKVIKHCAVGEVDLETIFTDGQVPQTASDIDITLSRYYQNQIGIIFMKVAGENASGDIEKVPSDELSYFKEYMRQIKDAGNQIQIISIDGDQLSIELDVYVDPLKIYINPDDLQYYVNPASTPSDHVFDSQNGVLISSPDNRPVEVAIKEYLKNLEFNGGLVRTFLVDSVQKAEGIEIPILKNIQTAGPTDTELIFINNDIEYFIPKSGYFDVNKLSMKINYIPYTFYRDFIE